MDFQREKNPGFLHRKPIFDAMYDVRYIYPHLFFDGKCRFIYHTGPLSWYEFHRSSKASTFNLSVFFPGQNGDATIFRGAFCVWIARHHHRRRYKHLEWLPPGDSMTSHTGPRLGRDQWISPIVFIWEDHFEGILAFFLRKFHWKLDSLVYIWLSKTEPWIVFFLACINIPKCNHGWWWWIKNTQTRTKRFFWLLVGDTLKLCNIETCAFYTLLVKAFLFQKKGCQCASPQMDDCL